MGTHSEIYRNGNKKSSFDIKDDVQPVTMTL